MQEGTEAIGFFTIKCFRRRTVRLIALKLGEVIERLVMRTKGRVLILCRRSTSSADHHGVSWGHLVLQLLTVT